MLLCEMQCVELILIRPEWSISIEQVFSPSQRWRAQLNEPARAGGERDSICAGHTRSFVNQHLRFTIFIHRRFVPEPVLVSSHDE